MKIPRQIVDTVEATTVKVHVKVCDTGSYSLHAPNGEEIAGLGEEYVPSFFPGEHYGDYLILDIDLETGKILNWKKPNEVEVARTFNLCKEE